MPALRYQLTCHGRKVNLPTPSNYSSTLNWRARTALDDANTNNSLAEQLAAPAAWAITPAIWKPRSHSLTTRANANLLSRTADNQALSDKLEISEDQLAQAIETISSQQARLAELENRLADANRTIDTTSQKLTEEKNLTANAKREVDELTTAMQTLQAEPTRLRGLLDDKKKEVIKDKNCYANLAKRIMRWQTRFRNYRISLNFFGRVREVERQIRCADCRRQVYFIRSIICPRTASIGEQVSNSSAR